MATNLLPHHHASLSLACLQMDHLRDGAPSHPLHSTRSTVRHGQSGTSSFTVHASDTVAPFTHFFETSVGSGHMSLTLRQDWREHVTMAARDLGVKHIRGHGTYARKYLSFCEKESKPPATHEYAHAHAYERERAMRGHSKLLCKSELHVLNFLAHGGSEGETAADGNCSIRGQGICLLITGHLVRLFSTRT